jgi:FMNH2-dependent dimethyl sulfone monooxygenase
MTSILSIQPGASASPDTSPADFPDSPLARVMRQPMMLGLFLPIQNGGWSPSLLPRSTTWTFDYNAALTLQAEKLGFDLVFGLAQWLGKGGHGGQQRYRETSLDQFIAVSALSAVTSRILLVSTVHVLYGPWHPLHLAKFGATLDHISGGRWGINLVTGNALNEALMFGMQRTEHDLRYDQADKFVRALKRLWTADEDVNLQGGQWAMKSAFVTPKPLYGRPILVNATGSRAGFDFAAKHSDIVFITSPAGAEIEAALAALPDHIQALRAAAVEHGRTVRTIINPMIVSGETDREAEAYHRAILAAEDVGAVDGFVSRNSDSHAWRGHQREQRVLGGNIQLIGGPKSIVDYLQRLRIAGIDGVQLTFFDFQPDLAFFGSRILPLMVEAGLRLSN